MLFIQKALNLVPKNMEIEIFWNFCILVFFGVFGAPKKRQKRQTHETCNLGDGNGFSTPKNPQIDPLNVKIG